MYDADDAAYAKASIANGSQSFAAASRLLPSGVREDVARLYAWCRYADDLIDGQDHGHGAAAVDDADARLAELRERTDAALAGKMTGDPIFDGFGQVAARRGITKPLAHDLLDGFQMDVTARHYETVDDLCEYCYGVAGAVGVMMGLTIGVDADDADTLDRACDLGLAFQMTNIARDNVADATVGRVYLPAAWLAEEGLPSCATAIADPDNAAAVHRVVTRLVAEADAYYASASVGVRRLPFRVAWAIASAGGVYRAIGKRRVTWGAVRIAERARTTKAEKLGLIARASLTAARTSERGLPLARYGLWQRPSRP